MGTEQRRETEKVSNHYPSYSRMPSMVKVIGGCKIKKLSRNLSQKTPYEKCYNQKETKNSMWTNNLGRLISSWEDQVRLHG